MIYLSLSLILLMFIVGAILEVSRYKEHISIVPKKIVKRKKALVQKKKKGK